MKISAARFVGCVLLALAAILLSCKKKEVGPSPPSAQDYLSGSGTVKYWQPVSILRVHSSGSNNIYYTGQSCAVDNYLVFFDNGDYEERSAGARCFADERMIIHSNTWNLANQKLKINLNSFSIYEITSTLFGSEVTVTELNATRFKGYRLMAPGDTIKFVLSAVPM